jgi:hypothetical protein
VPNPPRRLSRRTALRTAALAAAAALADLAGREQQLSVAHATAAGKVSGEPARLLAMVAAAESQLAASLTKKRAAR